MRVKSCLAAMLSDELILFLLVLLAVPGMVLLCSGR